jgi:ABC-type uncharacterized transport system substrate-binding protein
MARDLTQKRLQILKEAVPNASRIAVMMDPGDPIVPAQWREAQSAADRLGVQLQRLEVRSADDLKRAFQTAVNSKAEAILRLADPLAIVLGVETADLAKKHRLPLMVRARPEVKMGGLMSYYADALDYRLPAVYPAREFVDAGGFMAYGPNLADMYRRAATYIVKILKGAKPGDPPVEQPTQFELIINMKTAKTLGLTIPQSLLLRADEVIQ